METGLTHIKDLRPDPANRRAHNPRNLGMVVDALHQVGAARSIVIDEDGVVLAGNGVTEAAAEAGITKVQVVDVDGSTLVAVRRTGLSVEQKRALAIFDNRTAELAEWNAEQLQADVDAGLSLQPWFSEDEAAALLKSPAKEGLTDPDAVPEERPTGIVAGDLFELGRHRLLCGDSTVAGDVVRLMGDLHVDACITDPPYGIGFDTDYTRFTIQSGKNTKHKPIHGDERQFDPVSLLGFDAVVLFGANYFAESLPRGTWLVWDKRFANGKAWLSDGELAWMKTGTGVYIYSLTSQGFVRPEAVEHPTQKAVALIVWCMEKSKAGTVIYDPYVGSGTTIIACEQLGKTALAIEIEPSYVQVAIDRWEAFAGQKAQKVGEAVGV